MTTVEVYKIDRRTKDGRKLICKQDYNTTDHNAALVAAMNTWPAHKGYEYTTHDTFVTRTNLLSGNEFQERYDTPCYCSPSSESYWSM